MLLASSAPSPSTLHGTGAALWGVFATPRTLSEAAEILAAMFAADAATVEADIAPIIGALEQTGALRAVP